MNVRLTAAAFILSVFTVPALAQPAPEDIIAQGDKDGDKAVSKEEWGSLGAPVPFPDDADTNKDSKIDIAEMRIMFANFGGGGGAPPPPAPAPTPAPAPAPQ